MVSQLQPVCSIFEVAHVTVNLLDTTELKWMKYLLKLILRKSGWTSGWTYIQYSLNVWVTVMIEMIDRV